MHFDIDFTTYLYVMYNFQKYCIDLCCSKESLQVQALLQVSANFQKSFQYNLRIKFGQIRQILPEKKKKFSSEKWS